MTPFELTPPPIHRLAPFAPTPREVSLSARVGRSGNALEFEFDLRGADAATVKLPALQPPGQRRRRDELWQNTCLELFWGMTDALAYFELNLSPAGDWNIYRFDGYRSGMQPAEVSSLPQLDFQSEPDGAPYRWHGRLQLDSLAGVPLALAACAVLRYQDESLEYWALAHRGEKPDFHNRGSFILDL